MKHGSIMAIHDKWETSAFFMDTVVAHCVNSTSCTVYWLAGVADKLQHLLSIGISYIIHFNIHD